MSDTVHGWPKEWDELRKVAVRLILNDSVHGTTLRVMFSDPREDVVKHGTNLEDIGMRAYQEGARQCAY